MSVFVVKPSTYLDLSGRSVHGQPVHPELPVVNRADDADELPRTNLEPVERLHGLPGVLFAGVADEEVAAVGLRKIEHQAELVDGPDLLEDGNLREQQEEVLRDSTPSKLFNFFSFHDQPSWFILTT